MSEKKGFFRRLFGGVQHEDSHEKPDEHGTRPEDDQERAAATADEDAEAGAIVNREPKPVSADEAAAQREDKDNLAPNAGPDGYVEVPDETENSIRHEAPHTLAGEDNPALPVDEAEASDAYVTKNDRAAPPKDVPVDPAPAGSKTDDAVDPEQPGDQPPGKPEPGRAGPVPEAQGAAESADADTADASTAADKPVADYPEPATEAAAGTDGETPPVDVEPAAPIADIPEPSVDTTAPSTEQPQKRGFFSRLRDGLSKSSDRLSGGVSAIFTKRKLDDETLEELEDLLISADLGMPATQRIVSKLSEGRYDKEISTEEVRSVLAEEVAATLRPLEKPLDVDSGHRPHVILMAGVNGSGKTTTIGKLARKFADDGKSVMLAAGDTFRAAAIEQLQVWGERTGAPVVTREVGADAAGLAFDALKAAQEQDIDVLMIDTAGRLQNRRELMDELAKVIRVIRKIDETAPHDSILTLDATVGQNALSQAEAFKETAGVTGLVMTKLDGTARGGVLVALADKFALPIHYIGVGESVEDLQPFRADAFARALAGLATDDQQP